MFYSITINRNCNFNCLYCYQEKKRNEVISDDSINRIPDFIIKNARELKDENVSINISGGECLLYPNKVERLIETINNALKDNGLPPPVIELSTNVSLLTDSTYSFLKKNNCKLFIGFDGFEDVQNLNRLYCSKNDKTFNDCYKQLISLYSDKENRSKITINSVISNNNVRYLSENFDFLSNTFSGFNLSYNVAYNVNWDKKSITILKKQLFLLAEAYYNKVLIDPDFSINLFDRQIDMILRENQKKDFSCGAIKSSLGITCEGNIVACSTCIGMACEEKFIIGDIINGIEYQKKQDFIKMLDNINKNSECNNCIFNKKCYSYCPTANFLGSGDMFTVSRKMCDLNKVIISISEMLLIKLYKKDKKIVKHKYFNDKDFKLAKDELQ
jgi:radical SAM protein with 4Fe4S-binding SPASM domain